MNKGKRKEVPVTANPDSISSYIKNRASYNKFKTYDFLGILDCDGPEEAKVESKQQLNGLLSFRNLNNTTRSFIGQLLTDNLNILSNNDAKIYWKEKENREKLVINPHDQFGLYSSIAATAIRKAYQTYSVIDHDSSSEAQNNINNDESAPALINQYWLELLEQSKDDNSLHKYGIIIIDDGIKKSDQMDQKMYNQLLCKLNIGQVKGFTIHNSLQDYYSNILNTDGIDFLGTIAHSLPAFDSTKKNEFKEIYLAMASLLKNTVIISEEEKSYRVFFVHYICTDMNDYIDLLLVFIPAEVPFDFYVKVFKAYKPY